MRSETKKTGRNEVTNEKKKNRKKKWKKKDGDNDDRGIADENTRYLGGGRQRRSENRVRVQEGNIHSGFERTRIAPKLGCVST